MKFGPIGFWELLVIAVLVLLLFGPKKLPEMARSLSQAIRDFRRGLNDVSRGLQEELSDAADASERERRPAAKPAVTTINPDRSASAQLEDSATGSDPRITPPDEETRAR